MRQIETKLTRDKVAAELRRAILYGSFLPNEELSQDKIAADLGVSKMPVREAIQMLGTEGLIVIRPNRAPVVSEISDEFVRDHFEIRTLLEKEGIRRACSRKVDCAALWDFYRKAEEAIHMNDFNLFNYYNGKIHEVIWHLSGNLKLEQLLSQMWHTMYAGTFARKNALRSNAEHKTLIECIQEQEPEIACQTIEKHVGHSYHRILEINKMRLEKQK